MTTPGLPHLLTTATWRPGACPDAVVDHPNTVEDLLPRESANDLTAEAVVAEEDVADSGNKVHSRT